MIEREITPVLARLFEQYPVVTVTGPRQSGKTVLCRAVFPNLAYVNLEAPDQRDFAESDPRAFLAQVGDGAIIDEVQSVPELLSYIQVEVDERGGNSRFVLTGSAQFPLLRAISQSLAGRTALLRLLPFSLAERARTGASMAVDEVIFSGFYPGILNETRDTRQALGNYFDTYVERDIRRLNEIRKISNFRRFVRLCAGRVGQLVNLNSLASDAGVSHPTAQEWLTILEASYVVFQLEPFHANIRRRLIKSPKLYFYDVGLASYLIGIENAQQVVTHPLRGALFENVVVIEALKHRFNRGQTPRLSFFRDSKGLECDLLLEAGGGIAAIEAKSGSTVSSDFFSPLHKVAQPVPNVVSKTVVYGGNARQERSDSAAVPLAGLAGVIDRLDIDEELANFISERAEPSPQRSDIDTLDAIYHGHIRPTLDALEPYVAQFEDSLFRNCSRLDSITRGERGDSDRIGIHGGGVLSAERWEASKQDHLLFPGFGLSDGRRLALGARFTLSRYTGKGQSDFSVEANVEWALGESQVSRCASIDLVQIPALATTIAYSDLDATPAGVNRFVADMVKALLDRITELSAT